MWSRRARDAPLRLQAADVRAEVFGPHGVDEEAGAELVPKVLELILLEEDELLLKNLIKGIFDGAPLDDSDGEPDGVEVSVFRGVT